MGRKWVDQISMSFTNEDAKGRLSKQHFCQNLRTIPFLNANVDLYGALE